MNREHYRLIPEKSSNYQRIDNPPTVDSPITWNPDDFYYQSKLAIDTQTLITFIQNTLHIPYNLHLSGSSIPAVESRRNRKAYAYHSPDDSDFKIQCCIGLRDAKLEVEKEKHPTENQSIRSFADKVQEGLKQALLSAVRLNWMYNGAQRELFPIEIGTLFSFETAILQSAYMIQELMQGGSPHLTGSEIFSHYSTPLMIFFEGYALASGISYRLNKTWKDLEKHRSMVLKVSQDNPTSQEILKLLFPVETYEQLVQPTCSLLTAMPKVIVPAEPINRFSLIPSALHATMVESRNATPLPSTE